MRREPSPDLGRRGGAVQLGTDASRSAGLATGRAAEHAEQNPDGEAGAVLEPWVELLLMPSSA